MPDNTNAERIRAALLKADANDERMSPGYFLEVLPALDALLAALRQAEADRDGAKLIKDLAEAKLLKVEARCVRLETVLREAHELVCGCDTPGELALCVGGYHFEAIARQADE